MALQKSIETASGLTCPVAYIVVEALNFTKNNVSSYIVRIYKDKAARDASKQPILVIQDQIALDLLSDSTWMEQVYSELKLQDLFAGSEDV